MWLSYFRGGRTFPSSIREAIAMAEKKAKPAKKRTNIGRKAKGKEQPSERVGESIDFSPSPAKRFADISPDPLAIGKHLVIDPRICFGKMTFKGTRVPVETILFSLSEGRSLEETHKWWPWLEREAIEEALRLAVAGWPELLRPPYEEAILRTAKRLLEEKESQAKASDEPNHIGRTA
jgi:uncharacterized protein (DUF433 family)